MSERTLPTLNEPARVTLSHVVLRTAHLDETIEFYGKLLGMKPVYRTSSGAALTHDGEHHRMALGAVPPGEPTPRHNPGLEHIAWKLPSLGHLLANYRRLQGLDIEPFMCLHHGGTISTYYWDPDGVQNELFIDARLSEITIEAMPGQLTENPIGVPIDIEEFTARYEKGEPLAELFEYPEMEPGALEEVFAKLLNSVAESAP
jgi:catechol-2,3-dioxygenase